MRLMLWVGDEGPTDLDLKDGDIWRVYPNTWEPGGMELKRWLIVELPEYGGQQTELVASEYAVGSSLDTPQLRLMRKYFIPYWQKLTPEELAAARDREVSVPVITDKFTLLDICRK